MVNEVEIEAQDGIWDVAGFEPLLAHHPGELGGDSTSTLSDE